LDSHRERLRRLIEDLGGLDGLLCAIRSALGVEPGETADGIVASACATSAFDKLGLYSAAAALEAGSKGDQDRAATIRAWLDDTGARKTNFLGSYTRLFLKADGAPRAEKRLMTKTARNAESGVFEVLIEEQARVLAVHEHLRAVVVAASTAALLIIGEALLAAYGDLKDERALLDYDDLIGATRRLLGADGRTAWVHYKLDGGIDHILVDEAQDTSPEQWRIVVALAAEFFAGAGSREIRRTVFAVGDEKQSIFSFQGADPDAFAAMRRYFEDRATAAGEGWRSVELAKSYRATATVLDCVDRVFDDPATGEGVVVAGGRLRHISSRVGQAGLVELWPTVTPEVQPDTDAWDAPLDQVSTESPPAFLARRIADHIAGWLDDGEILESAGRPVRPGDIMILLRRRTPFAEEMVRCLKERRIPVAGTDRMVLTDQLAVMDLAALGHFALLPDDDLNLAVVLTGPAFGFDDDALFELAHGRRGSLWRALGERRAENACFEATWDRLTALLAKADFVPPFEFFAEALGRDGERRRILGRLGPDAGDPMDEFLSLALDYERQHIPSLQGFLHWLAAGETEVKRDLEHGRAEVRVMTVHGAKGLQSNIVFLPDTCAVPSQRRGAGLLWGGKGEPFVLWPTHRDAETKLCADLRDLARQRGEREYRRLLYVAMTRARDRLYVCGWEGKRGRDAGCWYDLVAAAVHNTGTEVTLPFGPTGWRLTGTQDAEPDSAEETAPEASETEPPPVWTEQAAPVEAYPPRPLAPSRPDADEPAARSPFGADDGARFRRGQLIHRLLQSLPEIPSAARAAAARNFLARPAHSLDEKVQVEIAAEVTAVLNDARFADVFGPGSLAEVPLVGVVGGQVVSAQVDRLVVTNSAVTVIDYKTNRPPPTDEDHVAPLYLGQMAAYRALLQGVYPDRHVRCLLLWTDGPSMMALSERSLDDHAP
jgi:ATP-dependent helicase/nuclease subunit A